MQERVSKEVILAEYLAGGTSHRKLEAKYGVSRSTVGLWVTQYFNAMNKTPLSKETKVEAPEKEQISNDVKELQAQLKELQAQLRIANLKTKLQETLIDIAEKEYGISIRKKAGPKQ